MNQQAEAKENIKGQEITHRDVAAVLGEQSLAAGLARAEIDQAVATAHRYPRQLDTVIKKIGTLATYNEAAAENCIYSLPRGGKPIIGASIGFANIVASSWGNCTDGARIVHIDRNEKTIVAEGGFHDLETNRKTIVPVQRRIVDRHGRLFNDDMIMVTGMAAASIARRNAILNAVPRALWFPIYEQALSIVRGTIETFAERKDKAMKAFSQFGIKPEQIFGVLSIKGDADLTLEHMPILRGMYQALRDGSTTVEEMFDPRRMSGGGFEKVENPLAEEGTIENVKVHNRVLTPDEIAAEAASGKRTPKKRGRPVTKIKPYTDTESAADKGITVSEGPKDNPVATAVAGGATATITVAEGQVTKVTLAEPPPPVPPAPSPLDDPRNVADYHRYARAWLSMMADPKMVEERWASEKDIRGRCSVIGEDLDKIMELRNKRIKELQSSK